MGVDDLVKDTEVKMFEAAGILMASLTEQERRMVSIYARLYAVIQLQRVAQELHRQGRHTLANEVAHRAEGLKD